jgi:hypothetical protein
MPLDRNMVVYRMPEGGLLIHSAVAMDDKGMAALDAIGRTRVVLVPNRGHRTDATFYKQRYLDARVICPRGEKDEVEKVIAVDAVAEAVVAEYGITAHALGGIKFGELAYEVDAGDGDKALIFNDVIGGGWPRKPGLGGWFVGQLGTPNGEFGVPRIARWRMLSDRRAFADSLRALAEVPNIRVVTTSHGPPVRENAGEKLRRVAASL